MRLGKVKPTEVRIYLSDGDTFSSLPGCVIRYPDGASFDLEALLFEGKFIEVEHNPAD